LVGNFALRVVQKPIFQPWDSARTLPKPTIRKKKKSFPGDSLQNQVHQKFIDKFVLMAQFMATTNEPREELQYLWEDGLHAAKLMRSKYYKAEWIKKFDAYWSTQEVLL